MKARPILFSAPMIQALLEGKKTQTRWVVKEPLYLYYLDKDFENPDTKLQINEKGNLEAIVDGWHVQLISNGRYFSCPYGKSGDLLWVRETWGCMFPEDEWKQNVEEVRYRATEPKFFDDFKAKPSIHMPRWASRLTLELADVRVERLQDISEEDAIAEGMTGRCEDTCWQCPIEQYSDLWESINGKGSWNANPWVWVITFKVHQCNIDNFVKAGK